MGNETFYGDGPIGKTILENLTRELDANNIKQFEMNLFFNTSFLV